MRQETEPDVPACTARHKIAVIGLGYAGLPLALLFAGKGFAVDGIDEDTGKIAALRRSASYLPHVADRELAEAQAAGNFTVTDDFARIGDTDAVIICVPTPLTSFRTPELTFLYNAAAKAGLYLRQGHLVMLESSSYPGTTREVLQPVLEKASGMKAGADFHIGYSPECFDPGHKHIHAERIPKVISGLTKACANAAYDMYSRVFERVVPVSSPETAEMANLLEQAQRFINITFMNEMAALCDEMRIDVWEVIEASRTTPFGFTLYDHGPGAGWPSIPAGPLFLLWKAQRFGVTSKLIQMSDEINRAFPAYIADRVLQLLAARQAAAGLSVLLYGVAYKKDTDDVRESPALELMAMLRSKGVSVAYHDPYVPELRICGERMRSVELGDEQLCGSGCVVIFTDHSVMPLERIVACAPLVFDTRYTTAAAVRQPHVHRLGGGRIPS